MKFRGIGMLLLGIYLILVALIGFGLSIPSSGLITNLLALIAGILLIAGR